MLQLNNNSKLSLYFSEYSKKHFLKNIELKALLNYQMR